jgi:predicted O-methyltransferase YrrM
MKTRIVRFLDRLADRFISSQQLKQAQNIKYELAKRANKTTVDYVEKHMRDVSSVHTKWRVLDLALQEVTVNGLYMEFGVFQGETINYIAKHCQAKVYGFDSFEGLPEFWRDGFEKGAFNVDHLPKVERNVTLIKGWFDETLPKFLEEKADEQIAFLHIDCDLYSSTKTIFDCLEDRIKPGTVIVFDEYFNFPGWENDEFRAFKEFIDKSGINYKYITYNYLHEQVALKII